MSREPTRANERVEVNPTVLVGKPVVAGTRIPITLIANLVKHGYDHADIRDAYPLLTDDDIDAALEAAGSPPIRKERA